MLLLVPNGLSCRNGDVQPVVSSPNLRNNILIVCVCVFKEADVIKLASIPGWDRHALTSVYAQQRHGHAGEDGCEGGKEMFGVSSRTRCLSGTDYVTAKWSTEEREREKARGRAEPDWEREREIQAWSSYPNASPLTVTPSLRVQRRHGHRLDTLDCVLCDEAPWCHADIIVAMWREDKNRLPANVLYPTDGYFCSASLFRACLFLSGLAEDQSEPAVGTEAS